MQFSTIAERMTQVIKVIVDNIVDHCGDCGLTANHIDDAAFQCFTQGAHEVTFRARLYATPNSTPQELLGHIRNWISTGASVAINGLLLIVDMDCDLVIESFSETECTRRHHPGNSITDTVTISPLEPKETFVPTTIEHVPTEILKTESYFKFSPEAVIIGAVIILVMLICAVTLTIIVAYICHKQSR